MKDGRVKHVAILAACVVSGVAGALAGGLVAVRTMTDVNLELVAGNAASDLLSYAAMSDELAAGRVDGARRRLEVLTDFALIRVHAARRSGRPPTPGTEATLARIRRRRAATGYVPDAVIAEAVSAALGEASPAAAAAEKDP